MTALDWKANNLRVTLFGVVSPQFEEQKLSLWRLMTGEHPTDRHQQPKMGVFQDSGIVGNSRIIMNFDSGRIDVLYTPVDQMDPFDEAFDVSLENFFKYVNAFLDVINGFNINRAAIGASLQHKTSSEEDSNRILVSTLGLNEERYDFSDFMYRINRPENLNLGDRQLRLNKVSTWSSLVAVLQFISQTNPGVILPPTQEYFIQLDLDINNKSDASFVFGPDEMKTYYYRLREIVSDSQNL